MDPINNISPLLLLSYFPLSLVMYYYICARGDDVQLTFLLSFAPLLLMLLM